MNTGWHREDVQREDVHREDVHRKGYRILVHRRSFTRRPVPVQLMWTSDNLVKVTVEQTT